MQQALHGWRRLPATAITAIAVAAFLATMACGTGPAQPEWTTVEFVEEPWGVAGATRELLHVVAEAPDEYYPALRTADGYHIHNIMRPEQKPGFIRSDEASFLLYADTYDRKGNQTEFTAVIPQVTYLHGADPVLRVCAARRVGVFYNKGRRPAVERGGLLP